MPYFFKAIALFQIRPWLYEASQLARRAGSANETNAKNKLFNMKCQLPLHGNELARHASRLALMQAGGLAKRAGSSLCNCIKPNQPGKRAENAQWSMRSLPSSKRRNFLTYNINRNSILAKTQPATGPARSHLIRSLDATLKCPRITVTAMFHMSNFPLSQISHEI